MEGVAVHHCQDCFRQEKHFLKVVKEQEYMCILQIVAHITVSKYKRLISITPQLIQLPKPEVLI